MTPKELPLPRNLITTLISKSTSVSDEILKVLKTEGLTIQQFNVLRILRGRCGRPASLYDISSQMIHANSNTTRVIDKLVIKKYVERVKSDIDARKIKVTITPLGLEVLQQLDDPINDCEEKIVNQLNSQQLTQFIELLSLL